MKTWSLVVGIVVVAWLALANVPDLFDARNIQDNLDVPAGELNEANTLGQTFVFHAPRLSAIHVRVILSDDFQPAFDGRAILHLRRAPHEASDLAVSSLALRDVRHNEYARFVFAPLDDSQERAFYFFVEIPRGAIERGSLSLWATKDDGYADGALLRNAQATAQDLAFRAYFSPDGATMFMLIVRAFERHGLAFALALLCLLAPSFAYLFAGASGENNPVSALALATALTLALFAVAPMFLAGLGWWLAMPFASVILWWLGRAPRALAFTRETWVVLSLALCSLIVGLMQIYDVAAPLWVDSPTHAEYIHTLVTRGRLPDAVYHLGFHSIAALFAQMSGVAIPEAMLVLGQLFITQTGLSVYALSKRITGNAHAAMLATVCVWFLAPTPAYFITWGRYPLLLGGAILPVALLAAVELIEQPRLTARAVLITTILAAGLAFAQIRLLAVYATFVVVWALLRPRAWLRFAPVALVALAVVATRLGDLFTRGFNWQSVLEKNAGTVPIDLPVAFQVVFAQQGGLVALFAGAGALVALWSRSRNGLLVLAWCVASLIVALVASSLVPPAFLVLIAFIPATLLVAELAHRVNFKSSVLIALIALFGARGAIAIINPTTVLFSSADEQAMEWIRTNTPDDARFVVNSFQWYGDYIVSADGGAWIPYLAQRQVALITARSISEDPDALAQWCAVNRITHVYLGRRMGILSRQMFAGQPEQFGLVYDQAGVQIYRHRLFDAR